MKKLRPILFSTPMVQAILDGGKTQTRRTKKLEKLNDYYFQSLVQHASGKFTFVKNDNFNSVKEDVIEVPCPYGKVGDVLWVRETFNRVRDKETKEFIRYGFKATDTFKNAVWNPSIHMPFEAARIFLEITDVRVQKLQEITPIDAAFEGIEISSRFGEKVNTWECYGDEEGSTTPLATYSFMTLWKSINGEKSWNENPWVWVIQFKRITKEEAMS